MPQGPSPAARTRLRPGAAARAWTPTAVRTAVVVGTGLIGTSIALALTESGVRVHLEDICVRFARTAEAMGAGSARAPDEPVDLAVIAVPPAEVGAVLAACQRRELAACYLDVAGVKARPYADVTALGCDTVSYLGSHPIVGGRIPGPHGARADLFQGRPWAVSPLPGTGDGALNAALELIAVCGGTPVVMDAADHDRAVALLSHAPRLLASLLAGRLEGAQEATLRSSGYGVSSDVAVSAPRDSRMMLDVLRANAGDVADVLDELVTELGRTVASLRALGDGDDGERDRAAGYLEEVLRRGAAGRARVESRSADPARRRVSPHPPAAVTSLGRNLR
ncbi:prephenate dehydrogenase/arogenate dehydrogenase family protein [Streptomyces sp. BR1]|uniref:prephenate dehydrogenase/arogenate dehydrogenase family protein n=1 Tax=Streptomyces sp. BR1 TaxID=1592323 RepID=UPI00402B3254